MYFPFLFSRVSKCKETICLIQIKENLTFFLQSDKRIDGHVSERSHV